MKRIHDTWNVIFVFVFRSVCCFHFVSISNVVAVFFLLLLLATAHCAVEPMTCKDKHLTDFDGLMHSRATYTTVAVAVVGMVGNRKVKIRKMKLSRTRSARQNWIMTSLCIEMNLLNMYRQKRNICISVIQWFVVSSSYELQCKRYIFDVEHVRTYARANTDTRQQIDFYVTMFVAYQTRCIPIELHDGGRRTSSISFTLAHLIRFENLFEMFGKHKNALYSHSV